MSHTTFRARVAVLGLLAVALSACAGAATPAADGGMSMQSMEITITMTDFAFEPAQITAMVGQPVKLTLVNNGALLHDFTSIDAEADVMHVEEGDEHEMDEMDMEMMKLHMVVDVGHTQMMESTPTRAGTLVVTQ